MLARRLEGLGPDVATLRRIDGGFAVVHASGGSLVAAVDRLRTVPLFYGQHGGQLYLSDDAYWVADQLPPHDLDEVCAAEFLLLGFVTGPDTLHPLVKQLQAGELLVARSDARGVAVSTQRYFTYGHHEYFTQPFDEILDRWDATFRRVMERFAASAAGRTIAVPLSGGWDSRLMVLELKRIGYDNVRCFTYGRPGIDEVKIAREVAAQLGYPWEFVEYSVERWRTWHDAPEFARYVRYADGLCSVPHVQDWPAVWELRRAGRMPDDTIFAPGHNGGFLFGENGNLHRMRRPTLAALVHNLERVHYGNWRLDDPGMRARVRERLSARSASWPPRPRRPPRAPGSGGSGRSARRSSCATPCACMSSGASIGGCPSGMRRRSGSGSGCRSSSGPATASIVPTSRAPRRESRCP